MEEVTVGSELEQKLEIYFKFDQENRGAFLVNATQGEAFLVQAIATHFEPHDLEKHSLLISSVLSQLNFNAKIKIFSLLLQNYEEIRKKFPDIEKDLEKIRKFRNKMAHYTIDSNTEPVMKYAGEKVSLEFHKNGKIHHELIDKQMFEQKISLSRHVTTILAEIDEMMDKIQKTRVKI